MINSLRSLLFRSAPPAGPVPPSPGASYCDESTGGTREYAHIIDCATDGLGVTHVRFELVYRYRHKTLSAGERTLSQPVFERRFPRRLEEGEAPF